MTVGELLKAADRLPFRPVHEALGDRPFIVVAPHPDDESLGCGGLIAEACRQGLRGKVVIVSDGAGSHPNSKAYPPERLIPLREEEAKRRGRAPWVEARGYAFPRATRSVRSSRRPKGRAGDWRHHDCVKNTGAGSLFVSWRHDPHCDHQASYEIVRRVQDRVGEVRLFEYVVWGLALPPSTEVTQSVAASGSASMRRRTKRSAAPLPRTARRRAISSKTIPRDFYSRRSTGPISIPL